MQGSLLECFRRTEYIVLFGLRHNQEPTQSSVPLSIDALLEVTEKQA